MLHIKVRISATCQHKVENELLLLQFTAFQHSCLRNGCSRKKGQVGKKLDPTIFSSVKTKIAPLSLYKVLVEKCWVGHFFLVFQKACD